MSGTITSILSTERLVFGLPILLILSTFTWVVYAVYFHPLARYPGPFLACVTRWWLVVDVARGKAEVTQRRLHAKYGPIVRIAPNEVAIADPEAIKTIYAARSDFTKTDFYLPWRAPWAGKYPDTFTCQDERIHSERRRLINGLYTMSNIVQMEKGIDTCVETLVEKLTECAESGKAVDIAEWAQWYAFDVIGELFFNRMFGFMKNAHDHDGYIHTLDMLIPFIAVICVMPTWARPLFLISGAMIPRVFKALKALKHMERAADACIAEGSSADKKDDEQKYMLQQYLNIVRDKGETKEFSMTEVKMDIYGFLIAGSDTTAAAITSVLYHLMRTPTAYTALTTELDTAAKSNFLSPTIQYHEAASLPYLTACCKEGMRLHASVGMTLPRHVPRNGRNICGNWIPGGARVGVNAAIVQRDKRIFGDDADDFVPERWFRDGAGGMERYMFQFGAGSRTCIGKNISLCEMYKVIPQLLLSFHLELVEPKKEWELHNYWFNKPAKVGTVVRKRDGGNGH